MEGGAHREDDVTVPLVEAAVGTQGHQRQLHFLEGQGVCIGCILSPLALDPTPPLSLHHLAQAAGRGQELSPQGVAASHRISRATSLASAELPLSLGACPPPLLLLLPAWSPLAML